MSTRSMTVLERAAGSESLNLYRHCDGYVAGAGKALLDALEGAQNATQVASRLVRLAEITRPDAEPGIYQPYELADWTPSQQGDLEHVYTLRKMNGAQQAENCEWRIEHAERIGWRADGRQVWSTKVYTLPKWRMYVGDEVAAYERRVADYERSRKAVQA